jgi:hypothetical protein
MLFQLTNPLEVAGAVVIVGGVVFNAGYAWRSNKAVREGLVDVKKDFSALEERLGQYVTRRECDLTRECHSPKMIESP